jgi:uncharacterized protein DUF6290
VSRAVSLAHGTLPSISSSAKGVCMARMKEKPRYNVISLRLSDEEMDFLQEITKRDNKRISEFVREALRHEIESCHDASGEAGSDQEIPFLY